MFRGYENGLKEDPLCFVGVSRVRSRVIMHHANEAQTHNQDKNNKES
jgi:hypothetical protein